MAIFVHEVYTEAASQESVAMSAEADALLSGEEEVAKLASSALAKVTVRRRIAEVTLGDIKDCPGYDGRCGSGLTL